MTTCPIPFVRRALGFISMAALLSVAPLCTQSEAASGTFATFAGAWSGSGTATLTNGSNEPIRCRAVYRVAQAGESVQLNLRCASDSYRFDLNGNVVNNGGAISGTWSETTRNTSGSVSGTVNSGQIRARVDAPGFAANLYITANGNRQSVSISSAGTELTRVTLTMARSGA